MNHSRPLPCELLSTLKPKPNKKLNTNFFPNQNSSITKRVNSVEHNQLSETTKQLSSRDTKTFKAKQGVAYVVKEKPKLLQSKPI